MKIEAKRTIKKQIEVEETYEVELEESYVVRIISGHTCVKAIDFQYIPSDQEIADVLIDYSGESVFAIVDHEYRLKEQKND